MLRAVSRCAGNRSVNSTVTVTQSSQRIVSSNSNSSVSTTLPRLSVSLRTLTHQTASDTSAASTVCGSNNTNNNNNNNNTEQHHQAVSAARNIPKSRTRSVNNGNGATTMRNIDHIPSLSTFMNNPTGTGTTVSKKQNILGLERHEIEEELVKLGWLWHSSSLIFRKTLALTLHICSGLVPWM